MDSKQLFELGNDYYLKNDFNEAKIAYDRALQLSDGEDNIADIYCNYGSLLQDMLELDEAEIKFRKALSINNQHTSALFNLAMLLQDKGLYNEAILQYKSLLEIESYDYNSWANLGSAYHQNNEFQLAAEAYRKAQAMIRSALDHVNNEQKDKRDEEGGDEIIAELIDLLGNVYEHLGRVLCRAADQYELHISGGSSRHIDNSNDEVDIGIEGLTHVDMNTLNELRERISNLREEAIGAFKAAMHLAAMHGGYESNSEEALIAAAKARPISAHMLGALTASAITNADGSSNQNVKTAPPEFVKQLFDDYSSNFDASLKALSYAVPSLIAGELNIQKERITANKRGIDGDKTWMVALDIGCGTGLLADALTKHASIILGVDLSPGMLSKAEALNLYTHLYSGDMTLWLNSLGTWWQSEGYLPNISSTTSSTVSVENINDDDSDGGDGYDAHRRKSSGSIVREVSSNMNTAHAPGLQPLLDSHVRLGPLLVVAADVFVYVGELSEVFKAVSTLLSNGGNFIFTTEHLHSNDDSSDNSGSSSSSSSSSRSSSSNEYRLQPSGRFAHSKDYLKRLARDNGLVVQSMNEVTPRVENGRPVDGLLVVLSKNV